MVIRTEGKVSCVVKFFSRLVGVEPCPGVNEDVHVIIFRDHSDMNGLVLSGHVEGLVDIGHSFLIVYGQFGHFQDLLEMCI